MQRWNTDQKIKFIHVYELRNSYTWETISPIALHKWLLSTISREKNSLFKNDSSFSFQWVQNVHGISQGFEICSMTRWAAISLSVKRGAHTILMARMCLDTSGSYEGSHKNDYDPSEQWIWRKRGLLFSFHLSKWWYFRFGTYQH